MISPSSHREVALDLLEPPRINLPVARQNARHSEEGAQPLSLEQELQVTRALRLRCERLLGELGCPVADLPDDLQRGAA